MYDLEREFEMMEDYPSTLRNCIRRTFVRLVVAEGDGWKFWSCSIDWGRC